ncbi:MAG: insulinase family protein [Oscillospiraceae bacterium]|nr:insulinase family protein [Oscillospiraceae bacterium]
MNVKTYPNLGEALYEAVLPNGLRVRYVPKKDFARKLAFLAVDFGSIDTCFTLDGEEYRVPDGIAHYLEHKMFDLPDEDANARFAELGAGANAFTSYAMTAYHFSCTEHFEEALALLLRMVTTPYFTEETVQKEQGIIAQEIRMYEDSAESRVYEDLFRIMFPEHPISVPITGTVESISRITARMLYDCHKAFYQPANMVLCVAGDVSWEQVLAIAEASTPATSAPVPKRNYGRAPLLTEPRQTERAMQISMPTFCLGFSCPPPKKGESSMHREIVGELASEILAGESSPLFSRLYEEGLIDNAFSIGYESVKDACLLSVTGDTDFPEQVFEAILAEAQRIREEGFDLPWFERLLHSSLGRRIRDLDSFTSICYRICAYEFDGYEYFSFPPDYETVTPQDVLDFLSQAVCRERSALATVVPKEDHT